ncbi:hypothetical protein ACP4OV_003038 [Aristida adscensionis]
MTVPEAPGDARVRGEECRINALPDELLLHAISYLDVRELVQTCVLSRRWRDLWRSVTRIHASWEEFDGEADTPQECALLFKRFVERMLMLRNPTELAEFSLSYHIPAWDCLDLDQLNVESKDANLWIGHALQSNVRSLKVDVCGDRLLLDQLVFPPTCFLTNLELSSVILFPGFFENLQTGCTVLERLILEDCDINDVEISSQTLKVLSIGQLCAFIFQEQACISIPSLCYLGFFAYLETLPSLKNMESLVMADVSVGHTRTQVDEMRQFLKGLSGVTHLYFNYEEVMLEMERNLELCPRFDNLTVLTLGDWWLDLDFCAFTDFLQNSPYLVKLTLKVNEKILRFIGELKEVLYTCEHLETLEIVCLGGDSVANSLEKLLLESGMTFGLIEVKRLNGNPSLVVAPRV